MKILETNILNLPFGNIVHFVNCKGVWGAGLAAQLKQKYPEAFEDYKKYLKSLYKPWDAIGSIRQCLSKDGNITIISCFTQYDTGVTSRKTEYAAVKNCMSECDRLIDGILYIPYKAGCGLGGGDWEIVSDIIKTYLPNAIICKDA